MPLWILPPLMAAWVNLHLGFVYGLIAVGAWCAALLFDRLRGSTVSLAVPALVAAGCLLATLFNPRGAAILWYPTRYAFHQNFALSHISEWQHPSIRYPLHWPLFAAAALLGVSLVTRHRPRAFLVVLTVAVLALNAQAVRNAPYMALLLPPVVGAALASRARWARRERDSRTTLPVGVVLLVALVAVTADLAVVSRQPFFSFRDPSEVEYPQAAAQYVDAHYRGQHLFNGYSDGGYLTGC